MTKTTAKKHNLPVDKIIELICAKIPSVQSLYLFGSTNTAFASAESDIDLAVLAEQKIAAELIWKVAQEIAILTQKDVDLVDLKQASTVMRWQVVDTGHRLFCQDKILCDHFENTALSAYIRFNEERREILEEIQKRGSVL